MHGRSKQQLLIILRVHWSTTCVQLSVRCRHTCGNHVSQRLRHQSLFKPWNMLAMYMRWALPSSWEPAGACDWCQPSCWLQLHTLGRH
jgi:hypothetical protein